MWRVEQPRRVAMADALQRLGSSAATYVFDGGLLQAADSSAAGVYQSQQCTSQPIALDELEPEGDPRRQSDVIKLARIAGSGGKLRRGSADHTAQEFELRSCFLFSSVLVPAMSPADLTRLAFLELGPLGTTTPPVIDAKRLRAIGAAIRRRMLDRWPDFAGTLHTYRSALASRGYRQLWKTTLQSWFKRVPRDVGKFIGAEGAPATHEIRFRLSDGTDVDFRAEFVAIGDNAVEDVLRGYEPTAFYLNEADLLAREVYTYARGRAGRYPDMEEGGPTWHGILMDANAPELSSWLYLDMFRQTPAGVDLFKQPGGLEPGAENLINLPPGYYADQIGGQLDWYVQRMINNRPGYNRAGKPVYPEFNDLLHVADRELVPVRGRGLEIGLDAGLTPAAVIGQRTAFGQWLILDELVSEPGVGAKRFGQRLAALLTERYRDWYEPKDALTVRNPEMAGDRPRLQGVQGWADPSAAFGADTAAGEASWIDIVAHEVGIRIRPAPTNALVRRLEAVRLPLTRLIDGKPGFQLSTRCVKLREGFNSGYRFRKINAGQEEKYDETPDKNDYSHPHDALQYLLAGGGEDVAVMNRRADMRGGNLPRRSADDYQPFG